MHSTAYTHQPKNGEWEVRLPIPGHLLSDKHPTLHKTKEAADLWIASRSGKNRNSLNIRRADRPYPCGFCGGSLCANSGHSLSTTARISSEIWSICSISSDPVDALVHRVFDFSWGTSVAGVGYTR